MIYFVKKFILLTILKTSLLGIAVFSFFFALSTIEKENRFEGYAFRHSGTYQSCLFKVENSLVLSIRYEPSASRLLDRRRTIMHVRIYVCACVPLRKKVDAGSEDRNSYISDKQLTMKPRTRQTR